LNPLGPRFRGERQETARMCRVLYANPGRAPEKYRIRPVAGG
jgi:hypothetical protein